MDDQTLLLVDEDDNFLGYEKRVVCHTGKGKRHRAFVTLLLDSQSNAILQKRRHKLFDNLWDLTAISHPLHVDGHDETWQEASDRALKKEMGIGGVKIKNIGSFNYFAKDGTNCENENCAVLIGSYDGAIKPNSDEVYETKKMAIWDFIKDADVNSSLYAPWAVLAAKTLAKYFKKQED